MTDIIVLKQGDTLSLPAQAHHTPPAPDGTGGVARNVDDWTPDAALYHDRSGTRALLTCRVTEGADGLFTLSATARQTAAWPPGKWRGDITFTDGNGVKASTETFTIILKEAI